jgi:hypothetical protein
MKKTPGLVRRRLERIGFVRVLHKAAVVNIKNMGREPTRRESLHEVDVSILLLWQNVGEEKHHVENGEKDEDLL